MALLSPAILIAATESADSERSREILQYTCSSDFGEHELTLFANGTLRLWEGRDGRRSMSLAELTEEELRSYRARLSTELYDRSQRSTRGGPSGEWVEQCRLRLSLGDVEPTEYRFSRVEGLSLDLANRLVVADELLAEAKIRERGAGFPRDYVPRAGDILLKKDGSRFRIDRYTLDGNGLEIAGIDSPLLMYIDAAAVTGEFAGLEKRERER